MSATETLKRLLEMQDLFSSPPLPFAFSPGATEMMNILMDNPGLSTEDPIAFEKARIVAKAKRDKTRIDAAITEMEEKFAAQKAALQAAEAEKALQHELDTTMEQTEEAMALEANLADFALELTSHYSRLEESLDYCTLLGPQTLTVNINGRFSKVAHIGQEEFVPFEAYVGKKGRILIKFRPRQTASYSHMEMFADEAMASLSGFTELSEMNDVPLATHLIEFAKVRSRLREQQRNKDKYEQYKDFGSF